MKTDVIRVSSAGKQIEKALEQAEKVAAYKGLSPRSALHLRLLTEEMMGMMRSITGEKEGDFWIEDKDDVYQLHLRANTWMTMEKREKLLSVSSTGKNEAAKGLMGRLREFFDQGADVPALPLYAAESPYEFTGTTLDWEWTMSAYQNELVSRKDSDKTAAEIWDEMEKSVVTHVADDVKIAIRGDWVEMTIIKKMK